MTSAAIYGRQSHGKKKSIADQLKLGLGLVEESGWDLFGTYSDKVGASTYSVKVRGGWEEIRAAVAERSFEVLVLWEPSRGDRKPGEWLAFLESCKTAGVKIHVLTDERAYDPRKSRDWKTLANAGVDSAYEVDLLSERARRGIGEAAQAGLPHGGRAPYGYRRVYDPEDGTSAFEVDPERASIVKEIIKRVSESEAIREIIRDFEKRGIPGPAGGKWYRKRIRDIALSRAYIGERDHKGKTYPAAWPAIVEGSTFRDAARVLMEPSRMEAGKHARPGRQIHLLSYYAGCSVCEAGMRAYKEIYQCPAGHVQVTRSRLDGLIRELAIARLSSPDLYASLAQAGDAADANLKGYEQEKAALTQSLEGWRQSARRGKTTPESLAVIEAGLTEDIEALTRKIEAARTPADLAGWVGPVEDVTARWDAAPVAARRTVLRAIRLGVRVRPTGGNARMPITDRVVVDWQ